MSFQWNMDVNVVITKLPEKPVYLDEVEFYVEQELKKMDDYPEAKKLIERFTK